MSDEQRRPRIVVPREHRPGVWANHAELNFSEHEFTLDFARSDPVEPMAVVVARVSCSAAFLESLIERLSTPWHDWAKTAMPPEVYGDDDERTT